MKKVYIASSWKHKHGVMMLTTLLRNQGYQVISWIENCSLEGNTGTDFVFEEWVNTQEAEVCFNFDLYGAMDCDIFIYYGNSGKDAMVELGAAACSKIYTNQDKQIFALWAKGEDLGLMRKVVDKWFNEVEDLISELMSPLASYINSNDDDLPF